MIALICAGLGFVTAYQLAHWIGDYCVRRQVAQRLGQMVVAPVDHGLVLRLASVPAGYLVPQLQRLPLRRLRIPVHRWLLWAGEPSRCTPELLIAQSIVLGPSLGIVGWLVMPFAPVMGAAVAVIVGLFLPWIWLRSAVRRRQKTMRAQLEPVLDLVALALHAGMELHRAVARVAELLRSTPMGDAFLRLHRDLRMGLGHEAAWRALAHRAGLPAIDLLVALLLQSQQLGTPLAVTLQAQAEQLRVERFQRAERQGALASQKVLVPVVVCILPAFFLLTFGGLLARLVTSGWEGMFVI